jgi:hypothetical protein
MLRRNGQLSRPLQSVGCVADSVIKTHIAVNGKHTGDSG